MFISQTDTIRYCVVHHYYFQTFPHLKIGFPLTTRTNKNVWALNNCISQI